MINYKTTKFHFETSKLSINSDVNSSICSTCIINVNNHTNNLNENHHISFNNLELLRRNSETVLKLNRFNMYTNNTRSTTSSSSNYKHTVCKQVRINESAASAFKLVPRNYLSTASIYLIDENVSFPARLNASASYMNKFITSLTHLPSNINRFGKYFSYYFLIRSSVLF